MAQNKSQVPKGLKKIGILVAALLVIMLAAYFIFFSGDPFVKSLQSSSPTRVAILIYGTDKNFPGALNMFLVSYEKKSKILKVVSVNTDMVVFKKRVKAESLKNKFYEIQGKSGSVSAETSCFDDIAEATDGNFKADFCISMNYDTFLKLAGNNKKVKNFVSASFGSKTLSGQRTQECVSQLEATEAFLMLIKGDVAGSFSRVRANYKSFDTNISKNALSFAVIYFALKDAVVMFCDLPVKYTRTRVIIDASNCADFFTNVFLPETDLKNGECAVTSVEVKNASGKQRMGEKAAWFLRDKKIDVYDWSNSSEIYDKTIIKDYCGNFAGSLKIAKALGAGKVIISYNNRSDYWASVYMGKDCNITDKFDAQKRGR